MRASEAAARAFLDACRPWNSDNIIDEVRNGLTAALPHLHPGVKVRALEWVDYPAGGIQAVAAGLGLYRVHTNGDDWYLVPDHMGKGGKSAAQAYFERRIRSQIEVADGGLAACHCTTIQQDETCPVGYPSLLCETCDGKGIIGGTYRVGDGDVDGWEEPCPDCDGYNCDDGCAYPEPPTARGQALEEAARLADAQAAADAELRDMARKGKDGVSAFVHAAEVAAGKSIAAAIRALANVPAPSNAATDNVADQSANRSGTEGELAAIIALCRDYAEDSPPDSEYRRACKDIIEALEERDAMSGPGDGSGVERGKFYHKHWSTEKLLEARRGGLVDHSGGEAWRYEYTSKDDIGEYDILYRHVSNNAVPAYVPAPLPSAPAPQVRT